MDYKEAIYQVLFLLLLFALYVFDRHDPEIDTSRVVFYLFYVLVSLFVSYVLIPTFFYTKKYLLFALSLLLVLGFVYSIEEFVLEKLFFPDNRGKYVSNVFYTLIDIVPFIIMMVSFKLAWDANKNQREVEQLRSSVQESELKFLKSQINPHFLFNNLNNLYSYAMVSSPKTPSIILELSSVLRYMLYDCKEDFVLLDKEIKHLESFVALNEMQIEGRGTVTFTVKGNQRDFQIAPLILVVFIENAFKHSTNSQSENIKIDIELEVTDAGELNFICQNSFQSISNDQNLSKGIGLENVKKRLQLLYPEKHLLKITESDNLYSAFLSLSLNSKS